MQTVSEENKAVVRRWLEDGMNGRDLAIIDELIAPDYANHNPALALSAASTRREKRRSSS